MTVKKSNAKMNPIQKEDNNEFSGLKTNPKSPERNAFLSWNFGSQTSHKVKRKVISRAVLD